VIAESKDELTRKHSQWKDGVEGKGRKVNVNETEVMSTD